MARLSNNANGHELRVNGGWLAGLKLVIVLVPILLAAHVAFGAWCVTQIINLRISMAEVRVTRFTAMDGVRAWEAIHDVREEVDDLRKRGSE